MLLRRTLRVLGGDSRANLREREGGWGVRYDGAVCGSCACSCRDFFEVANRQRSASGSHSGRIAPPVWSAGAVCLPHGSCTASAIRPRFFQQSMQQPRRLSVLLCCVPLDTTLLLIMCTSCITSSRVRGARQSVTPFVTVVPNRQADGESPWTALASTGTACAPSDTPPPFSECAHLGLIPVGGCTHVR